MSGHLSQVWLLPIHVKEIGRIEAVENSTSLKNTEIFTTMTRPLD